MIPAISNNFQTYRSNNTAFCGKQTPIQQAIEKMLSDIPEPLQKEAREMAEAHTGIVGYNDKIIYRPGNFQGVVLDYTKERDYLNKLILKLDLIANHDPDLYIGSHAHPINYIKDTPGYEYFRFETFEQDVNRKLKEIAEKLAK